MAARRVRRADDGRLWRPARMATPTRTIPCPTASPARQPARTATARHQPHPGRPRHAARAPAPALTPAPPARLDCATDDLCGKPGRHRRPSAINRRNRPESSRKEPGQDCHDRGFRYAAGPVGPRRSTRSRTSPMAAQEIRATPGQGDAAHPARPDIGAGTGAPVPRWALQGDRHRHQPHASPFVKMIGLGLSTAIVLDATGGCPVGLTIGCPRENEGR
jgi:hypothetical protein